MSAEALFRRLARIEGGSNRTGRVFIMRRLADETDEQALGLAGVETTPADLVVIVTKHGGQPIDRTPMIYVR